MLVKIIWRLPLQSEWTDLRQEVSLHGTCEKINENCLLTLAQIYQELRQRLPRKLAFHDRTVARTLEVMLYRVKLTWPLPADRNRRDVLQKRVDYANWFMRHAIANHSIFVDECGYNIWTARSHGRARLGERAYRQVCGQRGRNITVALTISPTNGFWEEWLDKDLMIFWHRRR